MNERIYLTVTALTKYIKRKFDADPHLQEMYIKGEISNFKQHSSGHMYFTLKDEKARILAVMFQAHNSTMKFMPENGMKVLIKGDITVYEPSGQYQIYVKEMAPDGLGELYLAYEQLKSKLEQEGLFSPKYKKSLPLYPNTIGVVTSPTGAAIRDILTTLKRRYPIANIIIYPALVQGNNAAESISKAIETANERNETDVLIIGRGGGSIEELWGFNEEKVSRAIFHSKIPIISAVGHETDFTIADFVADLRAPTPTGAAEIAVPHINEVMERLLNQKNRMTRAIQKAVSAEKKQLQNLNNSYAFRFPQRLYEQKLEQLDRTMERFNKGYGKYFLRKKEELTRVDAAIKKKHPKQLITNAQSMLDVQTRMLNRVMERIFKEKKQQFIHVTTTMDALSPLKTMDRGYSLIFTSEDKLVKSTRQVKIGDPISVRMKDGTLIGKIEEIKERPVDE